MSAVVTPTPPANPGAYPPAVPLTPAAAPVPPSAPAGPRPWRWTRGQYHRLGRLGFFDGKRVELIRGEVIEMSPIGWRHHLAKTVTADRLREAFAGGHWVSEQGPCPNEQTEPEPDVAVYPGKARDYTDHPTGAVLVVEVADTSLTYDTTTKAEVYATAGVADYWVVDLENNRLVVYRDPEALPEGLGATAYRTHAAYGPEDAVAPLAAPDRPVAVADLLP